jgi:hypothetical protein
MKIIAAVTLSLATLPFRLCVLFRQLAQDRSAQNAVHGNHPETVPSTGCTHDLGCHYHPRPGARLGCVGAPMSDRREAIDRLMLEIDRLKCCFEAAEGRDWFRKTVAREAVYAALNATYEQLDALLSTPGEHP